MEKHPLIKAYQTFIENRSHNKIGVIGQPDAGKSTLINHLCKENVAHTAVHTDATLETKAYPYNNYGHIVDFPGVGTEVVTLQKYKKIVQQSNIDFYLYVFSSKIREVDIEMIKYLSKQNKIIIFIFNKVDALVDISGGDTQEQLKRDKDTELQVTFKHYISTPLYYHFTSALNNEGIDELTNFIDGVFKAQEEEYRQRFIDPAYLESYMNYKVNSIFPKLFTPSFKNIMLNQNYEVIERTIMSHFKIQEDDIIDRRHHWLNIPLYLKEIEDEKEQAGASKLSQLMEFNKIVQLIRSAFKMKSINPVSTAVTAMIEIGVKNAFPVMQAVVKYMDAIKGIAEEMIREQQQLYK